MTVTVDSTAYTADATWPSADGFVPSNIIFAEVFEPVHAGVSADTTAYTADNTIWPTADGGIVGGAADVFDATVIAAEVPIYGGGFRRPLRPEVVEGHGHGILPPLRGEAYGVVGEVDDGLDELMMLIMLAA